MMQTALLRRVTRLLAFIYACYTSYRTWRPPVSLTGQPEANGHGQATDGGWRKRGYPTESDVTPSAFRILYIIGVTGMVVTDLGILWYFSGGPKGFLDRPWSVADLVSLFVMELSTQLREYAFEALGAFFTFK